MTQMGISTLRCSFLFLGLIVALPVHAQDTEAAPEPKTDTPSAETEAEKKPAPSSPRILIMDLKNNGVAEKTVNTLQGVITVQISSYDALDVISGDDVRQLVALQAEKQNAGCDDSGSCMAEIAGALGASLVVFGDVGQLGELLVVNLNLFNVDLAQSQGRVTIESPSLESFPGQMKPKIWDLLTPKMTALGFEVPERPEETAPVMLVKEVLSASEPLFAWPSAFFAGTLFLAGAGGTGYWAWGVLSPQIETLQGQKAALEATASHPETVNPDQYIEAALFKQGEINETQTTQNIAMAITIATGIIGLTGTGLGLFWNPFQEEEPATDETKEE